MIKRKKSHCIICGIVIYAYRTNKQTCGAACQKDWIEIQKEALETPRECEICGKAFYAKRLSMRLCSDACKKESLKIKSEFSIFQRDKFTCIYCGKSSIEDGVKLHVEHITAIAAQGKSELYNLITSCQRCNNSKHAYELDVDVRERIIKVLIERNRNLSHNELSELKKEVDFYNAHDNNRWMRISFKRRNAIKNEEYK